MYLIPFLFAGIFCVLLLGLRLLYIHIRDILLKGQDYKTLSNKEKLKYFFLAFIPVFILAMLCVIRPFFWIVPFIHWFLFWAILYGIIFVVIKLIPKKKNNEKKKGSTLYWVTGTISLLLALLYMGNSYYLAHNVFETRYQMTTDKDVPPIRIALIADTHVGSNFNGEGFAEIMKKIEEQNPDMLVIAGDFVDDETTKKDLIRCCEALRDFKTTYGIYFVPGNHDAGYYGWFRDFTYDDLVTELRKSGVIVLQDENYLAGDNVYVVGRKDKKMERCTIKELMASADHSYFTIVLDHQPNDYEAEAKEKCDLVLAGHTHGGHMFPIAQIAEYFDINDATYGYEKRGNTVFIVTSGMANWAIEFKSGTICEYCIIDVVPD